eukprot:TRINITY_DN4121_c0_g1_i1.p1 TRINITY_DN4121_c0_g1~~TRINITY_DN4121_c0_g1_i1.p1  ORF type:complete len:1814 (+),score=437.08 TRINITY_DN4121_c0_g1_i1:50-5443(+)
MTDPPRQQHPPSHPPRPLPPARRAASPTPPTPTPMPTPPTTRAPVPPSSPTPTSSSVLLPPGVRAPQPPPGARPPPAATAAPYQGHVSDPYTAARQAPPLPPPLVSLPPRTPAPAPPLSPQPQASPGLSRAGLAPPPLPRRNESLRALPSAKQPVLGLGLGAGLTLALGAQLGGGGSGVGGPPPGMVHHAPSSSTSAAMSPASIADANKQLRAQSSGHLRKKFPFASATLNRSFLKSPAMSGVTLDDSCLTSEISRAKLSAEPLVPPASTSPVPGEVSGKNVVCHLVGDSEKHKCLLSFTLRNHTRLSTSKQAEAEAEEEEGHSTLSSFFTSFTLPRSSSKILQQQQQKLEQQKQLQLQQGQSPKRRQTRKLTPEQHDLMLSSSKVRDCLRWTQKINIPAAVQCPCTVVVHPVAAFTQDPSPIFANVNWAELVASGAAALPQSATAASAAIVAPLPSPASPVVGRVTPPPTGATLTAATGDEAATVYVYVLVLSLLDRLAFERLAIRLEFFRSSSAKLRVCLCLTDWDCAQSWRAGEQTAAQRRLELVASSDESARLLQQLGPVTWPELTRVLDAFSNVVLVQVCNISDGVTVSEFFSTAIRLSKRKTLSKDVASVSAAASLFADLKKSRGVWLKELPLPLLSEQMRVKVKKAMRKKRHNNNDEFVEAFDQIVHEYMHANQELKDTLDLLYFMAAKRYIKDPEVYTMLLSHCPHIQTTWVALLPDIVQFIIDPKPYTIAAAAYVKEKQSTAVLQGPEVSAPFLMFTAPPKLNDMSSLTSLNLSHNLLSAIPEDMPHDLPLLQTLDLSWNRLSTLPKSVSFWGRLKLFNLEHNDLLKLPSSIGDCLQMKLRCGYNKLGALPHTLLHHLNYNRLEYEPNPFDHMPRCTTQGDLKVFLQSLSQKKAVRWSRIKLVLVGPENVGKTTLLARFQGRAHDGMSTDGISVKELAIQEITFSAWDFGGQAVFLPTHQFFLTGRALYLVLFNLVDPDLHRIEYWLRQIAKTVKSPPTPPVILVGTRADRLDPERAREVCNNVYRQFKCLGHTLDCIPISTTSKEANNNVNLLEECIVKTAITKYMILRDKIPGTWVSLDALITEKRPGKPVVHWDEFCSWANEAGITDPAQIKQAALFLHGVGSLLYFDSKYSSLGDLVVLEPQYLANLLCTIVTFKPNFVRNGILPKTCIPQIWRSYDEKDHANLINLLSLFLILHPVKMDDGGDGFIVPCILPPKDETTLKTIWPDALPKGYIQYERWFTFTCMPIGLFGRLLVRALQLEQLISKHFWTDTFIVQQAAHLDARPQTAFVNLMCPSGSSPSLVVRVRSPESAKPNLLLQILDCVETTLNCFYSTHTVDMQQRITCSHCPLPTTPEQPQQYLFPLEEVVATISEGAFSIMCPVENLMVRLDWMCPYLFYPSVAQITEADIESKTELATGGFGKIYKAKFRNRDVAVKELIIRDEESTVQFLEFKQEVAIMSALNSPYLVKLLAVCVTPCSMVMEFVPLGDLYKVLHAGEPDQKALTPCAVDAEQQPCTQHATAVLKCCPRGEAGYTHQLSWELRLRIALDVAKGLQYMHAFRPPVVHRDLRSPNVFIQSLDLSTPVRAKVADFGLSLRSGKISGTLSTWQWLAPEIIDSENESYDEQSDIFSLGMVMWEIATRKLPYDEYASDLRYCTNFGTFWEWKPQNIKQAIIKENLRPTVPAVVPKDYRDLILSCWEFSPAKRPKATQVVRQLEEMLGIPAPTVPVEEKLYGEPLEPITLGDPSLSWQTQMETKVWSFGVCNGLQYVVVRPHLQPHHVHVNT